MMEMFNPAVSGGFSCQALLMEFSPAFETCARPCFSVAAWIHFSNPDLSEAKAGFCK